MVRDGPEWTIYHFLDHPESDTIPFLGESPTNNQFHLPLWKPRYPIFVSSLPLH